MQREQYISILNARAALLKEYAAKKAKFDEVFGSAASASLSSGGGSKSYTNHGLAAMRTELDLLEKRIAALTRRIAGSPSNGGIRHVVTVRS